jgi:hypothetical protein
MAEESNGTNFLAFIVGGLVVLVLILFFALGGLDLFRGGSDADIDVQIDLPEAPSAPAN